MTHIMQYVWIWTVLWLTYTVLCSASRSTDVVYKPYTISSFLPGGEYLVLTFSNGPHHSLTPQVLDILKRYDVHATFFLYGQKAMHQPDLVQRMVAEGHDVAHQGFYPIPHPNSMFSYTKLSKDQVKSNLHHANVLLKNLTGVDNLFFRPPFGVISDEYKHMIQQEERLYTVLWSLDSQDKYAMNKQGVVNPDIIAEHLIKHAKRGDVILCHDTQPALIEALPKAIEALHKAGYEFLTLSTMLTFPDDSPH